MRYIMGIQIGDQEQDEKRVKELLSRHGHIIKTRLGLHDNTSSKSTKGIILIEFVKGFDSEIAFMQAELSELPTVEVRQMTFTQ